jgi:SOS-response transcriptional repressor LexA
MTPREREVLDFIQAYDRENRIAPTLDEIAFSMNHKSRSGAHRLVTRLIDQGHLVRTSGGRRNFAVMDTPLVHIPTSTLIGELQRRGVHHG